MEDGIAAGGDCDCGYECTETKTVLTEESVTTESQDAIFAGLLSYQQVINAETITVTFNGIQYECQLIDVGDNEHLYGGFGGQGPDFSQYPFLLESNPNFGNALLTETAGTYAIKIEASATTVEVTPCFENAVNKVVKETAPNVLVLSEERLGTPTVGGTSSTSVNYSDCVDDTNEIGTFRLWEDFDKYNGQPIIVQSEEDGTYIAQYVEIGDVCPSSKAETEGGDIICLKEATKAIYISTADSSDMFAVLASDTEFYTADR